MSIVVVIAAACDGSLFQSFDAAPRQGFNDCLLC